MANTSDSKADAELRERLLPIASDRPTIVRGVVTSVVLRIEGWIARLILILFVLLTIYTWLDVLVLQLRSMNV